MSDTKTKAGNARATGATETDGRRKRSERSKHRIAAAMIDLIMEGDLTPSAEAIAERAEVGLRSVFRHFKDMDSLFLEVSKIFRKEHGLTSSPELEGDTWEEQLTNLIHYYSALYDQILPMIQATRLYLHRSRVMREDHTVMNGYQRQILLEVLPKHLHSKWEVIESLDAVMSTVFWKRLRIDQGLPSAKAQKIVESLVASILRSV
jgi:AcrR family transcriptional regulator